VQRSEVQTRQQAQGGPEIELLKRKGALLAPFLILFLFSFITSSSSWAAEKKNVRQPEERQASSVAPIAVNDINVSDHFRSGEELLKKGKRDEALRIFQGIYDYTRDTLLLLRVVKIGYDKALSGGDIDQNVKEELYLKLQKITSLTVRYTELKGESAYRIGLIYRAKGNSEQARKYLLETCQAVPFSLDPASTWMKSKDVLLAISNLEGEF